MVDDLGGTYTQEIFDYFIIWLIKELDILVNDLDTLSF